MNDPLRRAPGITDRSNHPGRRVLRIPPFIERFRGLLLGTFLTVFFGMGLIIADGNSRYLRIRQAVVRSEPSFKEGNDLTRVFWGQPFEELSQTGDWVRVKFIPYVPGTQKKEKEAPIEGWLHATARSIGTVDEGLRDQAMWLSQGGEALAENPISDELKKFLQKNGCQPDSIKVLEGLFPSANELADFLEGGQLGLSRPDGPSQPEGVAE